MDITDKNIIDNYTPSRISECYKDKDGIIEITNMTGVFRLSGIGRKIWLMLDGKHTIRDIVDTICVETELKDKQLVKNEVIKLLYNLRKRKAIIVNWDPLYKFEISQELVI